MQRHVTYIRDSDRTRLIFVFGATPDSIEPPAGFRLAAERDHDGVDIVIPADGDDYGLDPTPEQRESWSPAFLNAMGRLA